MTRKFRDWSIKRKLTFAMTGVSFAALFLAGVVSMVHEWFASREAIVRELSVQAGIIGANSVVTLAFDSGLTDDDPGVVADFDSEETLATLRSNPNIVAAGIYGKSGRIRTKYVRSQTPFEFPTKLADGHFFSDRYLTVVRAVIDPDGEAIGTVYLKCELNALYEHLRAKFLIIVAGMLVCFLVALILSLWVQSLISAPILELSIAAKTVTESRDYSLRVVEDSNDEIGILIKAFNDMMSEIEEYNRTLEDKVEQRTAALQHHMKEAEEARDRALEANRVKSTFMANMSHELRTPLNAIIGYSEMLAEDAEDDGADEQTLADLERIRSSGKHLLGLINELLDLSKIEAGKMELCLETFEVGSMIDNVVTTLRPLAEKRNVVLSSKAEDGIGAMRADLTRVRQCLFNLVSNACKFTEDGTVQLEVDQAPIGDVAGIRFTVVDTGIGMTAEQLGKIFDAFAQADSSTTRKYGGTGLGLTITKRFAEMMGGTIEVQSEPGKGSKFIIHLPREVLDPDAEVLATHDSLTPTIDACILVIDDDPSARHLTQRFLEKEGFEVLVAKNGEEGLDLARRKRPDAITLDVLMPGMDGWALLSELKADPACADIPVIMLSITDDRSVGFALGATDHLTKPLDRAKLVSILSTVIPKAPMAAGGSVLVVEDDADTRAMLNRTLTGEGWNVAEAENGLHALATLAGQDFGAIVLDLMMPQMDGFELLARLRSEPKWQDVPVVIMTSKDITSEEQEQLRGSAKVVLQKGDESRGRLITALKGLIGDDAEAPRAS